MLRTLLLALPALLLVAVSTGCDSAAADAQTSTPAGASFSVTGSGVHYFTTAIVHAQEPTDTGFTQRSTDIIELAGDIQGYILYHPTSVFDFADSTLVNTGTQMFSGTIAGSDPVVLHDDTFRFESDLATGATTGEVHLRRSGDAPRPDGWFECDLDIVGTGLSPEGDALVEYSGTCVARGRSVQGGASGR